MFFKFLSYYGLTSTNNASFDEYILNLSRKLNVKEIKVDNGFFDLIFDEFFVNEKNIIISGTAGDGKTYLLRKLFFEWYNEEEFKKFIPIVPTSSGINVYFVKDFTELSKDDKLFILEKVENIVFNSSNERFVIAVNDGILIDSLKEFKKDKLLKLIEDLIDNKEHEKVALFDLFQTSSYRNFSLLLDEILERSKNVKCDYENCIIHNNIKLIEQFKPQILKIIKISDLNYEHLTFRKLFMIIANMILGYEKGVFSSCKEANKYYKNRDKIKSAFYNNIFLDNLNDSSREKFKTFLELNIGKESLNLIDDKILYEDIEIETLFFNKEKFEKIKEKYFEDNSNYEELNQYLIYIRRYLFFSNEELAKELIIYKYLDEFIEILKNEKVKNRIKQKIVVALNRIFLGELVDEKSELYIASSFTKSFSKVSDEIVDEVSIKDIKFEFQTSKIDKSFKKFYLVIKNKKLLIDLHLYEFLRRVAEGIMPLSFSMEYYEKVLNFKSKLIPDEERDYFNIFDIENFKLFSETLYVED
jgi:hypothetical protein